MHKIISQIRKLGRPGRRGLFNAGYRLLMLLVIAAMIIGTGQLAQAALPLPSGNRANSVNAANPPVSITGYFTTVWGDPLPNSNGSPTQGYSITDDNGKRTPLMISDAILTQAGGLQKLNGKRVTIGGSVFLTPTQAGGVAPVQVSSLSLAIGVNGNNPPITGATPYVNLLCKFPDVAAEPQTPAYFDTLIHGTASDTLRTYWSQVSYGQIDIDSSYVASQWVNLPKNKTAYATNDVYAYDLQGILNDCLASLGGSFDFSSYYGINIILNDLIGNAAWGGTGYLNINGTAKVFGETWIPPWAYGYYSPYISGTATFSHEMGHAFGMRHSAGPTKVEYDDYWDVLGKSAAWCPGLSGSNYPSQTYYCTGAQMNAYSKTVPGWIGSSRIYNYTSGPQQITIEPLDHLPNNNNYLMAKVPIPNSTNYYTVEVRTNVGSGFDGKLPGPAVIIHRVDEALRVPSWVMGSDSKKGAMWTPGGTSSTYQDTANNTTIRVDAVSGTGFKVTINPGPPPAPTNLSAQAISASQINLSWQVNSTNETGFSIERKTGAGAFAAVGTVGQGVSSFQDTNLTPGTTYSYQVKATSADGDSGYSNTASATTQSNAPTAPTAPTNLTAQAGSTTQVNLSWSDNSSNEDGFRIERKTGAGAYAQVGTVNPNVTTYQDTSVVAGTAYTYRVFATSATQGDSLPSNEATVTTGSASLVVNHSADDNQAGSFMTVLNAAQDGDNITFDPAVNSITLNNSTLTISKKVTITGSCDANTGTGIKVYGPGGTQQLQLNFSGGTSLYGLNFMSARLVSQLATPGAVKMTGCVRIQH